MSDCEYLEDCPIWEKCQSDIKNVWVAGYCKGAMQKHCARKKLVDKGKPAPENLMPNGTTCEA